MADEPEEPRARGADVAAELIPIIDRLEALLERSDVVELEVEVGGTSVVLRKPDALLTSLDPELVAALGSLRARFAAEDASRGTPGDAVATEPADEPASNLRAVLAPLTGIYYAAPAPGALPYVRVGTEIQVGQVIGLIEAMKLFNEIKSDVAGRVVRIAAESGTLVKAKQPLIEVEPR